MVDTLKGIGPGDIVVLAHTQFKVYKLDAATRRRTYYKFRYSDTGQVCFDDHRPDGLRWPNLCLATFVVEEARMKTVPTTFKGHAKSSDCNYHGLALFVSGNQEAYREWLDRCKPSQWSGGTHDAQSAVVAHGPSTKDDTLRRVCLLEAKPWVVGSNSEYFTNPRQIEDSIKEFGKIGAKKGWYVTEKGVSRGSQVLAEVGLDLVKSLP